MTTHETLFLAAVLIAALFPILTRKARLRNRIVLAGLAIVGVLTLSVLFTSRSSDSSQLPEHAITNRPIAFSRDGYVTSTTCRSCHPNEHDSWHDSFHRTMTQVAAPDTVIGRFDGEDLIVKGEHYRFERRGDEFWAEMPDPEWKGDKANQPRVRRQIVMTTGSHHRQVYWYPTGQKRKLGQMPLVYLKKEERWIPRSAAFLRPSDLPYQQETARWNITCVRCHTTHGRGRIAGPNDIDTDVAEFGISCEACHGPGEEHVRLNRDPKRRYQFHFREGGDPSIVNPARLPPPQSAQACGQCHGIWEFYNVQDALNWSERGYPYRPGDDLSKTRNVVRYDKNPVDPMMKQFLKIEPDYMEGRFWSDGMVRVSGREYNGLKESPCAKADALSCISCHKLHQDSDDIRPLAEWANDQLGLKMETNEACFQCHDSFRSNLSEHTHHKPASSGSECYNCHMPHTTYGLLKAIRSHQIDNPSVASSLSTGRPNACNLCHLDKTLSWTADVLHEWHGQSKPEMSVEQETIAASLVWLLRGDAGQRALIAWSMGWHSAVEVSGSDWMPPFLALTLEDSYEAVRFIGERSLKRISGYEGFDYDFVGPAGQRSRAKSEVFSRWETRARSSRQTEPELLFDSNGSLDESRMLELLKSRDHRRMNLKE